MLIVHCLENHLAKSFFLYVMTSLFENFTSCFPEFGIPCKSSHHCITNGVCSIHWNHPGFKSWVLVTPEAISFICALQMRSIIPLLYTGLKVVCQNAFWSLAKPITTSFPQFVAVLSLKCYSEQSLVVACYKGVENSCVLNFILYWCCKNSTQWKNHSAENSVLVCQ